MERNLRVVLENSSQFAEVIDYADFESRYFDVVARISGTDIPVDHPAIVRIRSVHFRNPQRAFSAAEDARKATAGLDHVVSPNGERRLWPMAEDSRKGANLIA